MRRRGSGRTSRGAWRVGGTELEKAFITHERPQYSRRECGEACRERVCVTSRP